LKSFLILVYELSELWMRLRIQTPRNFFRLSRQLEWRSVKKMGPAEAR